MVIKIMKIKLKKAIFPIIIYVSLILSTCLFYFISINKSNSIQTSSIVNSSINKIAYLTIDDGPSKNTEKILKILDNYNIKATFFVVGPKCHLKDTLLKKIVESGHSLAIHSYEHNYNYIYASKENYLKDFYNCLEWIKSITGFTPTIYRFPGGSSNTIANKPLIKDIIKALSEKGFTHADWNVDTLDSYMKDEPYKITKNALTAINKNENNHHYNQTILIHDDIKKPSTITALPSLIEKVIAKGYTFKTLNEKSNIIQHIKIQ